MIKDVIETVKIGSRYEPINVVFNTKLAQKIKVYKVAKAKGWLQDLKSKSFHLQQ